MQFRILFRKAKNLSKIVVYRFRILVNILNLLTRSSADSYVYLDVSIKFNRYLLALIQFLLLSDIHVSLKLRSESAKYWDKYYQKLTVFERFSLVTQPPNHKVIYISDKPYPKPDILVDPNYFKEELQNSYHFPVTCHPDFYFSNVYKTLTCKTSEKSFCVGFAGNLNEKFYDQIEFQDENYLSRCQLVAYIQKHLSHLLFQPTSYSEYLNAIQVGKHKKKICIIDRRQVNLNLEQYLDFLRRCRFSLCPPGITMIYSHNLVESLSVGCVPILQYAHRLQPQLTNLENCLTFHNADDFIDVISKVCNDKIEALEVLSSNAFKFYTEFMTPVSVVKKINQMISADVKLMFLLCGNTGEISVKLAKQKR
ncbi:MAG: hypothetical protein AAF693_08375 [Bacteroidota bacterium]